MGLWSKHGISMRKKQGGIKPVRPLVLLLVIFVVSIVTRLIENIPIATTQLAYYLLNGVILTGFLAWLVPKSISAHGR